RVRTKAIGGALLYARLRRQRLHSEPRRRAAVLPSPPAPWGTSLREDHTPSLLGAKRPWRIELNLGVTDLRARTRPDPDRSARDHRDRRRRHPRRAMAPTAPLTGAMPAAHDVGHIPARPRASGRRPISAHDPDRLRAEARGRFPCPGSVR